ncbi:hypothetical protein [Azospirillum picis]|uniref:Uncharacterized protein n=1 Tax=Azospirillum picis TaxID=488438 RepID=A0ABU0MIH8_9PROT|nr:hypothetical protein [Azospirillum picis]MBP2299603.1 hypothetical protein [Azospirillum picis]MDQ0533270.1 hypothetical protein [Azospirillum picis]
MDDTVDTGKTPPAPVKPAGRRDERLAARLRENLRKRKEQARQREREEG